MCPVDTSDPKLLLHCLAVSVPLKACPTLTLLESVELCNS
uniref:Uncharacterized protein n=1 Tax=Anguilla anguilla TaxID=7936 RepID=A0A0E9XN71_ANGAN